MYRALLVATWDYFCVNIGLCWQEERAFFCECESDAAECWMLTLIMMIEQGYTGFFLWKYWAFFV